MKIAVVTGASSGLGREFVRQIASTETLDEIWVIARRQDKLKGLEMEIPSKLKIFVLDLLDKESIKNIKECLKQENPEIKILVNASGFGKYGTYKDLTDVEINQMIDLNCKALIHMTYTCLRYMRREGRVIMMGSSASFSPLPDFNMYAATKAFVVHFSRALNVELKSRGISVTSVCPGFVRTEFFVVAKDTKNPSSCTNFKPMYEAEDVVRKALKDSQKGKDMSVYGIHVKVLRLLTKLLPHKLVMHIWLKIK